MSAPCETVDAAPLRAHLNEVRERPGFTLTELCEDYVRLTGCAPETAKRTWEKLHSPATERVSLFVADRWCALTSVHPLEVYGESWYEGFIDTRFEEEADAA